jgi:lysophospholipase L1-like esterase
VGGKPLVPTPVPSRILEFIGDSMTCGYGVEGAGPSCGFTTGTENEAIAYGALTAKALGAAHVAIAWSGKGMYRNFGGDMTDTMPTLWTRTLATQASSAWGFTSFIPDVVVINLSTNDFAKGDPGQPYVQAYTALLTQVRAKYPRAYIFCANGPMLGSPALGTAKGYIQSAIAARNSSGDMRIKYVEFATQTQADGYGCDYHPSPTTQKKMSDVLVPAIRSAMGW